MAKINDKDLNDLASWTPKELRKLRININNRIETLKLAPKAKELAKSHILHGKGIEECESLLVLVKRAEKGRLNQDS